MANPHPRATLCHHPGGESSSWGNRGMTEHVSFVIGDPTSDAGTRRILNHGTTIFAVKFYDIPSIAKSNDSGRPLTRVVCPQPELARPVDLVPQRHPDPGVTARVRNREPDQGIVLRETRDYPGLAKHPTGWQWYPSARIPRRSHRGIPRISPREARNRGSSTRLPDCRLERCDQHPSAIIAAPCVRDCSAHRSRGHPQSVLNSRIASNPRDDVCEPRGRRPVAKLDAIGGVHESVQRCSSSGRRRVPTSPACDSGATDRTAAAV